MEKNPEFSVVITAYNKGMFIRQAVESVLNQTYQDFEIIVVDDGSTDNTKESVSSIPDSRIRYIYQENSGLPACARNKGMSLSKGKYIAFLDGDDFWHIDKLNRCKKALDSNSEAALLCHNEAVLYNDKIIRVTSHCPDTGQLYEKLLLKGSFLHISTIIIRSSIFLSEQIKFSEDKDLFTIEDYEYCLRLSQRYKFCFIPDALTYYRITDGGIFLTNVELNTINTLNLLDRHFSEFYRCGIDKDTLRKMRKRRSSVMCAAGRLFQHKSDFKKSRNWYLKAMTEFPSNYKAIIGFLLSLFKFRIIYR